MTPYFVQFLRHPIQLQNLLDQPSVELTPNQTVLEGHLIKHQVHALATDPTF